MTRVNCVPVEELNNKHLFSEYREITRIAAALKKSIAAGKVEIPDSYRMGKGHVKFFYDKGKYLAKRTETLYRECVRREIYPTYKIYPLETHPAEFRKDWTPGPEDQSINRKRIAERLRESRMKS